MVDKVGIMYFGESSLSFLNPSSATSSQGNAESAPLCLGFLLNKMDIAIALLYGMTLVIQVYQTARTQSDT